MCPSHLIFITPVIVYFSVHSSHQTEELSLPAPSTKRWTPRGPDTENKDLDNPFVPFSTGCPQATSSGWLILSNRFTFCSPRFLRCKLEALAPARSCRYEKSSHGCESSGALQKLLILLTFTHPFNSRFGSVLGRAAQLLQRTPTPGARLIPESRNEEGVSSPGLLSGGTPGSDLMQNGAGGLGG